MKSKVKIPNYLFDSITKIYVLYFVATFVQGTHSFFNKPALCDYKHTKHEVVYLESYRGVKRIWKCKLAQMR